MAAVCEKLRLQPSGPVSVDRATRTFKARALSGRPIRRYDSSLGSDVEFVFDPAGADLERFNSGVAPLLDSHDSTELAKQLGVVRRAWFEGAALLVECELSARPEAERFLEDIAAGVVRGVSLGLEILESRIDRRGEIPRKTVTKWTPYELSLVPVPADTGAMVLSKTGGEQMEQNTDQAPDARAAVLAEAGQILKLAKAAGLPEQFAADLFSRGVTVDQARAAIQDELVRRYERTATRSQVAVVRDGDDVRREGMALALQHRVRGGAPAEEAKPWLHLSLPELARECLAARGARVAGFSPARIVELAMSTSDFPQILGNFASKSLLDAYRAAEPAIKRICRLVTAADFKERRVLRIGEGSPLLKTPEGAPHTYGSVGEWKASYSAETWGRIFMLTRQSIINDDLGAFDQFVRNLGYLAADVEAQRLVSLLTANAGAGPVLDDGLTLFHATHNNLAGAGSAISVQSVDVARASMRTQTGIDGVVIDAEPRFLVVPAARQTAAEQLAAQITPSTAADVNPFAGRLEVVAEPRLDGVSTTAWYLFASPDRVPAIEFAYLEGAQGPTVETETDFDTDAIKYKVRVDFGAGVVDWRGAYRNPGA